MKYWTKDTDSVPSWMDMQDCLCSNSCSQIQVSAWTPVGADSRASVAYSVECGDASNISLILVNVSLDFGFWISKSSDLIFKVDSML